MGKRATTDAAKAEKALIILDKATSLFLEKEYDEIKMSELAKELGMSNGILYVYFKTKETLFMSLLKREYHKRIQRILDDPKLQTIETFEDVKKLLLLEFESLIDNNPLYLRLESMRAAVLEKNADLEMIFQMKKELHEQMQEIAKYLCKNELLMFDELSLILSTEMSILTGSMLNSCLSPEIMEIMDKVGMSSFKPDFKKDVKRTFRCFLEGYQKEIEYNRRYR